MRLADLAAEARVRPPWEGVDLGFVIAREWYRALLLRYLATLLPLVCAVMLIFGPHSGWTTLTIWWLKPLYEAPLLIWLSRRMFSESPDWRQIRGAITNTGWRDLFGWLTLARLSPSRSFLMPVGLLESLAGAEKRERIAVLRFGASTPAWLTVACAHFELVINLSLLAFAWLLVPAEHTPNFAALTSGTMPGVEWVSTIAYLLTLAIVAPFYVAGGFALYLTRRSELEAWDLEIRLRRLVERRAERGRRAGPVAAACFALALVAGVAPPPAAAAPVTRELAHERIGQVLARPEFGTRETREQWVYVGRPHDPAGDDEAWRRFVEALLGFAPGIADLLRALAWIGAAAIVVRLVLKLGAHPEWLRLARRQASERRNVPPGIFGLDRTHGPLPADVEGAARALLAAGESRQAVALLLRATLAALDTRYALALGENLTEQECAAVIEAPATAAEAAYFRTLLETWLRLAYAHEQPAPERLQALVAAYGDTHGATATV